MDGQIDGRINRWMDRCISLKDRRLDKWLSNIIDGLIYEYISDVDPDPHSFGSDKCGYRSAFRIWIPIQGYKIKDKSRV